MGSDHDVYQDSSFHIPAIYMNDWPDRYIHTNFDSAANIDPTKLKRAAFIGAASGYFLANVTGKDQEAVSRQGLASLLRRHAAALQRTRDLSDQDISDLVRVEADYRDRSSSSFGNFTDTFLEHLEPGQRAPQTPPEPFTIPRRYLPRTQATGDGLLV